MLNRALLALLCSVGLFGASAAAASADTTVADNGFRPSPDGFSFENYDNDAGYENLTPAEMQKLFGSGVCGDRARATIVEPAPSLASPSGAPSRASQPSAPSGGPSGPPAFTGSAGNCTLTPPAQQWMDTQNKSMGGGHCNGFAVLTEQLYKNQFEPFGAGSPYSYQIKDNPALQRAIAYTFVYQVLDSVVSKRVKGTPNQILNKLKAALNTSNPETYTLGIYKPDGSGGHAITPFAVVDHGGGIFGVQVYDNNYPGKTREVVFNTTANTWSYNAAINPTVAPELYSGTARNPGIELDPTTPGEGVQPCPFCQPGGAASEASATQFDTVQLTGNVHYHTHLVIRDRSGHQVGVVNGKIVNTFPGAQVQPTLAFSDYSETQEPAYLVPIRTVSITVDGSFLQHTDTETLSSVGAGQDVAIQNLKIGPGQRDVLNLNGGVQQMSFTTPKGASSGSPVLRIGADSSRADYALILKLVSFHPGATLHVKLNQAKQLITLYATGNPGRATYVLSAVKETRTANYILAAATIRLRGTQAVTYSYAR